MVAWGLNNFFKVTRNVWAQFRLHAYNHTFKHANNKHKNMLAFKHAYEHNSDENVRKIFTFAKNNRHRDTEHIANTHDKQVASDSTLIC